VAKKKRKRKGRLAAIAEGQILRTQRAAATYASCSARTVRRWLKEGMLTALLDGKTVYIKSQLDFFKRNEGSQPTEAKIKGQTADAEYKNAKAKLMQMELELKQGELIRREDFDQRDIAKVLAVKRSLLGLGRRVAGRFPPEMQWKLKMVINKEVRIIIAGFAGGN